MGSFNNTKGYTVVGKQNIIKKTKVKIPIKSMIINDDKENVLIKKE